MDSYAEQIIRQKTDGKRKLLVAAAAVVAVLLNVAILFLYPLALVITIAGSVFGVYWLAASMQWEVEYSVTNGDIDIDRIVAKSRRSRLVRVSGAKIEQLLPVKCAPASAQFDRVVMAASAMNAATWCFTYHSKKNGHTIVFFEPSDKVLRALYDGLPRLVQIETDRARRAM